MKLAEALLRRKELQEKLDRIGSIKRQELYEVKCRRINVTESLDDITAEVPKLTLTEVTAEYDHYAKQLRLIDGAIQQTNWTTEVTVEGVLEDYTPKA